MWSVNAIYHKTVSVGYGYPQGDYLGYITLFHQPWVREAPSWSILQNHTVGKLSEGGDVFSKTCDNICRLSFTLSTYSSCCVIGGETFQNLLVSQPVWNSIKPLPSLLSATCLCSSSKIPDMMCYRSIFTPRFLWGARFLWIFTPSLFWAPASQVTQGFNNYPVWNGTFLCSHHYGPLAQL